MKILNILTSPYSVEHNICTLHGRNIKTRYFGLILILRFERDCFSIRLDRMQLSFKEHFQLNCIPKVVRLKTGEVLYEKSYMSLRPPPKISLRHDHDWTRGNDELGSTVEQQPVDKLVQQSCGEVQHATFSQLTQTKPKPICDRSGKLDSTEDVFVVKGETSRSHEIDEKGFHGELCSSDRSGKPDNLSENIQVEQIHDRSGPLVERRSSSAHTHSERTICS